MASDAIEGFQLSPQQRRRWLFRDFRGAGVEGVLALEGQLAGGAVESALRRILEKQEVLRTVFRSLPGMAMPIQVILDAPSWSYREVDAAGDPEERQTAQTAQTLQTTGLLADLAGLGFDLAAGPVARFVLVRMAADRHRLLISLPALCADGGSLAGLAAELVRELTGGAAAEEEEEAVQYADVAAWLNEQAEGDAGRQARERWRARQLGPAQLTRLRPDREPGGGEPARLSTAAVRREIGERLTADLDAAAASCGAPLDVLLLACWQGLLWRLAGGDEVVTGRLEAGRRFASLQAAIGPFASWVPARCRFDAHIEIPEVVQALAEEIEAVAGQEETFAWEDVGAGAEPWFPTSFAYSEWPPASSAAGVRAVLLERRESAEPCDLLLGCVRLGGRLALEIQFRPDLYSHRRIEDLAASFERFLAAVAAAPATAVAEIDIVGADEARRLTRDWNDTAVEYPRDVCLHELFAAQVDRAPGAPAVSFEGRELTFGELDRRANRLARFLIRLGVGPEARVALCLERSLDALVAVLAILKAGGAYAPLDMRQPRERLASLLQDLAPRVVLTAEHLLPELPPLGVPIVCLDARPAPFAGESGERPAAAVSPDNLAYVLYTSGSTGRPKGVMIPHRAVVNLAYALRDTVYAGEAGPLRIGVNASLAFDASVKQLAQWLHGHAVCPVPEEARIDGAALLAHAREERLDALDCTPAQLRLMLAAGLIGAPYPRLLLVGGEAVDRVLWEALAAAGAPAFYNVYGPTECTVDATACRIAGMGTPTIGRPIPNVRVILLDSRGRLVPAGSPGELCIAGSGVGRGYLGRPEGTAERFTPDPFAAAPGGRLYRTGDLARQLPDGRIECLGRLDHQVKVRGFRIELGEIEAALERHPGVAAAVVVAREDVPGERRLVAYAVPRRRAAAAEGRPRHHLPNGLAVVHQNRNETEYLYDEIFVKGSYLRHGVTLPEKACVFDVGANIGMFTLYAGLCSPGCRVYAFEPIGPIFDDLRANAELHGIDARLFPHGLAETEGTAHFSYYRRYSMMSGLRDYADPADEVRVIKRYLDNERSAAAGALLASADELLAGRFEQELVECRLRRLSDVCREEGVERIDLLKVDVQRAELDVLRGIDEADWERIEQVVMEVHDAAEGASAGRLQEILDLLRGHGFDALAEQDELLAGTDRHNLYAVRPRGARRLQAAPGAPPPPEAVAAPGGVELAAAELRDFLRRQLPEPMVPADCVLLPALPLTRNGKVDRAALPPPALLERPAEAPRGVVEETLAAIWGGLLRIGRVAPEDNFFALGGHSLLATQLISRVREAFAAELPIRTVFETSTLRELAERIEAAAGSSLLLPAVEPGPPGAPAPLSFPQRRLWLIDRLEPGTPLYNNSFAVRFAGPLQPPVLAAVLAEIVRRHAVLRTVFAEPREGEPVQTVQAWRPEALPVIDLAGLRAPRAEAERLQRAQARAPFDLARGPLLRACLVRTGTAEHTALLTLHHIVCDGWSLSVLAREMGSLYAAFAARRPSPLPELPVQYADHARWQRRWQTPEALAGRLAGWRSRLDGLAMELPLPADRPRPLLPSHRGGRRPFSLDAGAAASLRAIGREAGATPFMVLVAALQLLLARHAGVDDVAVGSPVAGRDRLEIEGLIGFFVNTVVLRGDLSGDPVFPALVARVREAVLFAHQSEVPFEVLVDALSPERRLGRSPLFRVLFVLRNEPREDLRLAGLEVTPLEVDPGIARLDLTVLVEETGEGLAGFLEYARDLFDAATVDRLAGRWRVLLAGIAADPGRSLSALPLLDAAEQEQLLAWRGAPGSWELAAATLPRRLAAVAAEHPDAPAVIYRGAVLSYRELFQRSHALAGRLRALGVGLETEVGICLPRSPEMVIAVLAVLAAGGAYVPLDPAYPAERLALLMAEARPAVLVAAAPLPAGLGQSGARIVLLDAATAAALGAAGVAAPAGGPLPESAAYRLYTSGSTGRPKGVMVAHRGLYNLMEAQIRAFGVGPGSRVLQLSSLGFDASISEILMALGAGAALVLADREDLLPGPGLAAVLRDTGITHATVPPSVLAQLPQEELPALVTLVVAGEACPPELAARWAPGRRVLNAYGPTEITVCATIEEEYSGSGPLTIGRPMAGAEVHVLDALLRPVPPGVAGELCVGGVGVARGYAGRPDLTAERFIPDPLGAPGARLYRTGDLARHRPDGRLDFLGRADRQVKVRGVRVEPGEVEAALRRHPAVRDAAVAVRAAGEGKEGREGEEGDRRLVAWVVPRVGGAAEEGFSPARLRTWLRDLLPEALIPSAIVPMAALPLTPHGKLDLAALPDPAAVRTEGGAGAPRTPAEEVLAGIWEEVLGLERAGVDDDFFALGGHSLLATRVTARVRAAFGVDLPLRALFEAPTVAGLARVVASAAGAGALPAAPPLLPAPRTGELPLSFAQQRLWFLDQLDPGSSRYNLSAAVRLEGALDARSIAVLAGALSGVVRRHEALRTSFPAASGRARQEIAPARPVPLPVLDLSALPAAAGERELGRLATEDAERPFDLARGPVLRAALVRLGPGAGAALFALHHIASDGRSLEIFLEELTALAAGELLPVLPVQYADYAVWQRRWLGGEALETRLRFWRERLAGAPALLALPTDRPRPAIPSARGLRWPIRPDVTAAQIRAAARREGVTPFLLVLAAFQIFLGRVTDQDDLCLGTPVAGRDRLETEGLIGFFVNTLVLRADLAGDPGGREMLARTRAAALAAHQHGDLPFEKLVDELRPGRDLRYEPLFQALFGYQRSAAPPAAIAGLAISPLEVAGATAKLDLDLSLVEQGDEVAGRLDLRRDLFDAATAARLATGFERLLAGLIADPARRLSELPLLAPAEIEQLSQWGHTGHTGHTGRTAPPLPAATVPALFARQAAERPEATAVLCGGERLTFGELDRRSGRLARALRDAGVGPEERVALCAERSLALAVGVLGVLRSGGALVPLDPSQPASRLAWMMEDCGASLLVTQESLLAHFPALPRRVLLLEELVAGGGGRDIDVAPEVDPEAAPENLAYSIYTSGTTGRPKGALVEHGGLAHLLATVCSQLGCGPDDRMPCLAPATFDIFLFELLGPLLAGGTVSLLASPPALDLDVLAREIEQATLLHAVPALMRQIVDEARRRGLSAPRLRGLLVGGDAVPAALLADLRTTFPQAWIRILYGPTEGTILASSHAVANAVPAAASRPLLGRPLPGVELRVCDGRGNLAPAGSPGELWIGGPGVARGYHRLPGLTAARWVPADHGRRYYRTGDLVRWRADGELELLGRADDQVKVRGVRIEPGEVEAALLRHPGVAAAAVAAREPRGVISGTGGRRLVAWIVPRETAAPDATELRAFLAGILPGAMIPSAFVELPALPLTAHGKVDRIALPEPGAAPAAVLEVVAPRSSAEEILARIWAEVLGLERVGMHDNFFTLGGDSILSIQIVARAHQAGLRLSPRQVFQQQTVAELAAVAGTGAAGAGAGGEQGAVTGAVPLVPIQRRFFEGEPIDPHQFNQALLLTVDPAAVPALRGTLGRAVAALLEHHDALRLCFRRGPAGWEQEIAAPAGESPYSGVDLASLPPAVRPAALADAAAALQTGFDLAAGPLLRAALIDLGEAGVRLWLGAHHLAVDGVSWRILLDDLRTACGQLAQEGQVRLPPKTTSFQSWGERLAALARSGERRREMADWLAVAHRGAAAVVPPGGSAGEVSGTLSVEAELDTEETRALLHDAPSALRAQVHEVLLAAVGLALCRRGAGGALLVDVEGHGREEIFPDVDLSRTVGWLTTIHPVALDPGPDGDPAAALLRVKQQLRAVPDRGLGYGVLRYLDAESSGLLRPLPAAAVAFNYLGRLDAGASGPFRLAPEPSGPARSPRAAREHALGVAAWVAEDRLHLDLSYHPAVLTPAAAAALAADLLAALRQLLALARQPRAVAPTASDFPLADLGHGELDALLGEVDFEGMGGG